MAKGRNPDFMNGVPELLILRLLKDREMYGYDLATAIREATGGEISLGEGVIYPTLHDLERQNLVGSSHRKVGGRTRIYYRLTGKGEKRLADQTSRWARLVQAVATCIKGESGHAAT